MMNQSNLIHVACVQQSCSANLDANLKHSIEAIEQAANQGVNIVCLQELHRSMYFCQTENEAHFYLAESLEGPTVTALSQAAKQFGIVIIGSVFEKRGVGVYHNTAVVLDADGSLAGHYRKMHIPDDPGYYEKYYFAPGDLGFTPIQTQFGKLGVLVCWDQWYPEAARLMALAGAQILVYPTAIGWEPSDTDALKKNQQQAWKIVQQSHAITNALPVVVCNRTGREQSEDKQHSIDFWGNSFICDGQGEILAKADANQNEIVIAEIDLNQTKQLRHTWPFLRDRRIDAYAGLQQRMLDK